MLSSAAFIDSRTIFDGWCALEPGAPPAHAVDAMQMGLAAWQAENFPVAGDLRSALGVAEECGELAEAVRVRDTVMVVDGFGDVLVYLGQLLIANRRAIRPWLSGRRMDGATDLTIPVGRLCHVVLKHDQKIRGMADIERYRDELCQRAADVISTARAVVDVALGQSPASLAADTYLLIGEMVLRRNWRADPARGESALTEGQPCR